jgi:hypothetical protein
MSRSRSRACKRFKRLEASLCEAVTEARSADAKAAKSLPVTSGHGALWNVLKEIERSNLRVWQIVEAIQCSEDEIAMIMQVVAPDLAGMTPGSVFTRRKLAN